MISEYFILLKKEKNYLLNHIYLKYSTKIITLVRKFKLKLYANQDEPLADLKSRPWL